MLLADEFFFVALDDRTGRPRLSPKVFGLGLAAALLAELMLEQRITIEQDQVRVLSRVPPADTLTGSVLYQLVREPRDHPVGEWLVFLARHSAAQVADRLRHAGYIRPEQSRWRRRGAMVFSPVDINEAAGPVSRLATMLGRDEPMTWQDWALCGLAWATDLDGRLTWTGGAPARRYLVHIVAHLTPSLHALVAHLRAAVGAAAVTGRT